MSERKSKPSWSKCLPIELWPARDQAAWKAAPEPGDLLDPGGVVSYWSLATQGKTASGYGRYLSFLLLRGGLDPLGGPADRITRERVVAYHAELERTNRGHTIQNRIQELGDALRALAPEGDWGWILRGAGRVRASTIPAHDKRARLRPIEELVAEGLRLIEEAENAETVSTLGRALQYRDGLILVFLGFHLPRLHNLAELEVGRHIAEVGGHFILQLFKTKAGPVLRGTGAPYAGGSARSLPPLSSQVLLREERTSVERRLRKLVDAIADGVSGRTLKDELDCLERRQQELESLLSMPAEAHPLIHPNLAAIYRQKATDLHEALHRDGSRDEAPEIFR